MKARHLVPAVFVLFGCSEPMPRDLDSLVQEGDGELFVDLETNSPHSGPVFRIAGDDSTRIVFRAVLRDGELHGPFTDYDPESFRDRPSLGVYQKGEYRDGLKEGPYAYFYSSGIVLGQASYKAGLRDGSYTSWYESGETRSEWAYSNGERNGPYVFYHEDGQLWQRGVMAAGERCGEWLEDDATLTYKPCPPGGD